MSRQSINLILKKRYSDGEECYSQHVASIFSMPEWRKFAQQASHSGCTVTIYQPDRHD